MLVQVVVTFEPAKVYRRLRCKSVLVHSVHAGVQATSLTHEVLALACPRAVAAAMNSLVGLRSVADIDDDGVVVVEGVVGSDIT